MISLIKIIRCIRMQRVNYKHIYVLAVIWMVLLYSSNNRQDEIGDDTNKTPRRGEVVDVLGDKDLQEALFPPHRKVSQAEAYKALTFVRENVLKEYLGKDLPPWINPEVNGSQPELGNVLESRQVRKVVIATTWRSGSTFLGDLMNAYPGTFYHFEPFHYIMEQDSVPRNMEAQATGLLSTLLTCRYDTRAQPYLHHITSQKYRFLLAKNPRMDRLCIQGRALCLESSIVATACALHPVNIAKTVRLRLSAFKQLIKDPSLDLHIIHLVRDPRGVVNSRSKMPWCKGITCRDLLALCQAANQDAHAARELSQKYPKKFLVVRYEDLVLNPYKHTRQIFEFLELPLVSELAVYIDEHTNTQASRTEKGDSYTYAALYSTYRNSSATATQWRRTMAFPKVQQIQEKCRPALRYYGYRQFETLKDMNGTELNVIEAAPGRSLYKQLQGE